MSAELAHQKADKHLYVALHRKELGYHNCVTPCKQGVLGYPL